MPHLPSNGTDLYYEIHGSGPPLVLLHGLGSSGRDWEYQLPALAPSYQIIAPDLRGHGQSAKPPGPYTIAQLAADVRGLLEALQPGPAHLVGLSLGGAVALQLALDAPQRVKTLTLVNSAPDFRIRSCQDRLRLWQRLALVLLCGMRKTGEALAKRLFVRPELSALRQQFITRFAANDPQAYRAALDALVGWNVRHQLPTIACPTLILSSEHDYTSVAFKQAYAAEIPNARLEIIPNTRHALPVENPAAFNQALCNFLADNP